MRQRRRQVLGQDPRESELGATPERLRAVLGAGSIAKAREALDALKADVKRAHKRLAFDLHPDRNEGTDDQQAKADRLVALTAARDRILGLTLKERPPQPQPVTIVIGGVGGFWPGAATGSASTSTTSGGFYTPGGAWSSGWRSSGSGGSA